MRKRMSARSWKVRPGYFFFSSRRRHTRFKCDWSSDVCSSDLWNFGHVFRHSSNALMAVLLLWTLAFNLLQLFVYRRLGRCRRPKDPTDTIRHIVEVMLRDVATLPAPIPWANFLLDTS